MGKKEISYKGRVEYQKAIEYLEELVKGLKRGSVYLQNGEEEVQLHPAEIVHIEASASQKKEKEKFTLELSWYLTEPEINEVGLQISTSPPATAEDNKTEE
jgi:amphi-Trp domain-containing protein